MQLTGTQNAIEISSGQTDRNVSQWTNDLFSEILAIEIPSVATPQSNFTALSGVSSRSDQANKPKASRRPDQSEHAKIDSARSARTSTARDDRTADDGRCSVERSGSGRNEAAASAVSVDGEKKGVEPGVSTEATVSAQHSGRGQESESQAWVEKNTPTLLSQQSPEQAAGMETVFAQQFDPSGHLEQEQTALQSDPAQNAVDDRISAEIISQMQGPLAGWAALNGSGTMFESGLAAHFVRALTDQFDQVRQLGSQGDLSGKGNDGQQAALGVPKGQGIDFVSMLKAGAGQTRTAQGANTATIDRIMQIIRNNIGQRQSQLTVRLDPPELGRMKIDVRMTDNQLKLEIVTETAKAQKMMSERIEVLRSALESQGVNLARVQIHTRDDQANMQQSHYQAPNQFADNFTGDNGNGADPDGENFDDAPTDDESVASIEMPGLGQPENDQSLVNLVA